jgi:DNA-directed RNA polymerase subunit omega
LTGYKFLIYEEVLGFLTGPDKGVLMARVSIEDCLEYMENRFALVAVAADRARQLMAGQVPTIRTKNKEGVTALREIADGNIESDRPVQNNVGEE